MSEAPPVLAGCTTQVALMTSEIELPAATTRPAYSIHHGQPSAYAAACQGRGLQGVVQDDDVSSLRGVVEWGLTDRYIGDAKMGQHGG